MLNQGHQLASNERVIEGERERVGRKEINGYKERKVESGRRVNPITQFTTINSYKL